jgi:hypothetical protein
MDLLLHDISNLIKRSFSNSKQGLRANNNE